LFFFGLSFQGLNTAEIGLGEWNTWIDEDTSGQDEDAMGHNDEKSKQQLVPGMTRIPGIPRYPHSSAVLTAYKT
jgi:hypothetical protein